MRANMSARFDGLAAALAASLAAAAVSQPADAQAPRIAPQVQELQVVDCPGGWMSPRGYARYLRITLSKMRKRKSTRRRAS